MNIQSQELNDNQNVYSGLFKTLKDATLDHLKSSKFMSEVKRRVETIHSLNGVSDSDKETALTDIKAQLDEYATTSLNEVFAAVQHLEFPDKFTKPEIKTETGRIVINELTKIWSGVRAK